MTTEVQAAAASYGATLAGAGMTLGGCAAAHDAYDAQVRAWISQMVQMSASMDAFMDAHGGYSYADMSCVANAMLQELDAHKLAACTFSTLTGDQTEAARHVGVMTAYTGHVSDRCGQMAGGQYVWGPAAPVCGGTTGGGTPVDPLALGQRIFDTGIGTNGQAIPRTGGYGMMGSSGCASCHGYDGLGRTMMMFATPNITYANLTDPAGMLDPTGSRGPTYTDDLIRRAVTQGIDAGGSALSTIMPRWQLGDGAGARPGHGGRDDRDERGGREQGRRQLLRRRRGRHDRSDGPGGRRDRNRRYPEREVLRDDDRRDGSVRAHDRHDRLVVRALHRDDAGRHRRRDERHDGLDLDLDERDGRGMMGGGGMMGGSTMPANAGTTGLATAMTAFVGSARNASGVPQADMQPLIDKLAASNGTIQ